MLQKRNNSYMRNIIKQIFYFLFTSRLQKILSSINHKCHRNQSNNFRRIISNNSISNQKHLIRFQIPYKAIQNPRKSHFQRRNLNLRQMIYQIRIKSLQSILKQPQQADNPSLVRSKTM